MLIRWVVKEDKSSWSHLAGTVAHLFDSPDMATDEGFLNFMDSKIKKFEALCAIDRISGRILGIIAFSRTYNRISWFAVQSDQRQKGIGTRLLATALRNLDNTKDISVITFTDDHIGGEGARKIYKNADFVDLGDVIDDQGNKRCKMMRLPTTEYRGGSFHYNYSSYDKLSKVESCLCCGDTPPPDSLVDIAELEYSYATAEKFAQGKLFGKCHVLIKNHYVNFEDINHEDMTGFMSEVQKVGMALRKVTGAIKINYEIHSNSVPHIHCHLFPRYLDDDFPSGPIDYRICEPSPYESEDEFTWFVEKMREELGIERPTL